MNEIQIKIDGSRGLIIDRTPDDYEFGASKLTGTQKVLVPDGQWTPYLPATYELQRNDKFDTFGCVSYSHNNAVEIMHKRIYGFELDFDDRDLVVGSGTTPNRGNGVKTVADWARKNGLLKDKNDLPDGMTQSQYYSWQRSAEDKAEAEKFLTCFKLAYEWLPTCNWGRTYSSPEQLMTALFYGVVQASVDGSYQYNADGTIGRLLNWSHEIVITGYVKNKYWLVYDSEATQVLKFEWTYKFGFPMVHTVKKNNMKIIKEKGKPAIYFVNPSDNSLVAYADGIIAGGDMFKILFGDYSYAPIETLEPAEFAKYKIAPYQMTTINS